MASSKSSAMESLKAVTSMDRKPTGCLVLEAKHKTRQNLSDFQSHIPKLQHCESGNLRESVQPQLQKHGKWVSFLLLDASKLVFYWNTFCAASSREFLQVLVKDLHLAHASTQVTPGITKHAETKKKKNVSFQRPDWMPRAKLSWLCFSRPKASVSLARWNVWEGFTVYHRKTRGKQGKKTDEIEASIRSKDNQRNTTNSSDTSTQMQK